MVIKGSLGSTLPDFRRIFCATFRLMYLPCQFHNLTQILLVVDHVIFALFNQFTKKCRHLLVVFWVTLGSFNNFLANIVFNSLCNCFLLFWCRGRHILQCGNPIVY